jgi:hypothetical protein
MGIETDSDTGKETLRIEPKSHFFDTSEDIIDIGNVKGFSASVDKNLSAGKVEIGWPGGTDDKDVITYEPCAKSQWQLPNFNNDKKLDIVSSVRADGTEIVRIISEGDDKSANELFFVEVDANETFTVFTFKNDGTGSVTTDTPPTPFSVYNASLTPRNCMLNHVNYLSCLNWNYSGYPAIYISGENRLNDISIKQYNEGFATMENADINLVTPIYFYPIVFEIDAIISNQIIDLLNANPHRKISFTFEDNNYQGWLKDITINIYRNSEGKIKLLACAGFGNIIYNLIR